MDVDRLPGLNEAAHDSDAGLSPGRGMGADEPAVRSFVRQVLAGALQRTVDGGNTVLEHGRDLAADHPSASRSTSTARCFGGSTCMAATRARPMPSPLLGDRLGRSVSSRDLFEQRIRVGLQKRIDPSASDDPARSSLLDGEDVDRRARLLVHDATSFATADSWPTCSS